MQRTGVRVLGAAMIAGLLATVAPQARAENAADLRIGSFAGAFLAARIAETDNDLASAIQYYRRALSFDRDNVAIQQSLLLALVSQGNFDEALPFADRLKTVPEVERFSRLALAIDAFRKDDHAGAEMFLKLALESDLDRLITGLMTGWAKLGAGDAAGAVAHVRGLSGPEWYTIFKTYHQGLLADAGGMTQQALDALGEAVDNGAAGGAAPETYMRAAEAHARLLAREGRTDDALATLDRADAFAANRPAIVALRRDIETGAAVEPMIGPARDGAAEVLLNLGSALNRGGGEAFVRLYLQFARALKPDSDAVLVQLGQVAEQQGAAAEAITFYENVPENSPLKRIAELQLGLNLADLDRHDEAKTHLRALLEADPDDMRAYLALGGVHAAKEEYREAAALYDDAVERIAEPQRTDWNIFYQRGIAYERLKEWPKAEPNFRKALELFPDQPQVLNYLGYSWVDMNMNLEEGLEMIQRAVNLRPNDGYIVDSLGWAYYRLGRYEDAVRELERAVSLKPNDPILNDHLGDAYWRAGRKLEATFQWAHARDMKPDADVLASVERKLVEGLPAKEEQKAEIPPIVLPEIPAPAPAEPAVVRPAEPAIPAPVEPAIVEEPAMPAAAPQAEPAIYTVRPGQSLWSIAVEELGSGERFRDILRLNPRLRGNPGNIRPGQELILPAN